MSKSAWKVWNHQTVAAEQANFGMQFHQQTFSIKFNMCHIRQNCSVNEEYNKNNLKGIG